MVNRLPLFRAISLPSIPRNCMQNKENLIKRTQSLGILLIVGITFSITAVDILGSYRDFNSRSEQIRAEYIEKQKQLIQREVQRVVEMVSYEKSQREVLTRKTIRSRVNEAFALALNIYRENEKTKSENEIQKMIIDALRPIRFAEGKGYYFATGLNGIEKLFADRPEMEGMDMLTIQDSRGNYVVRDMINIVRKSGEGFYEYYWTKPQSSGNDFKKISFVKHFSPYDWFIGTGLYVDDIEKQIKNELLETIAQIRFGEKKNGYIFVVTYDGTTLMNDTQRHLIGKNVWNLTDPNGVKVIQEERKAVENPRGDFIYYSWNKPSTKTPSPKTSFIQGVKGWQWMIGAGVYLDDVEQNIALLQAELYRQVKKDILSSLLISLAILLCFLFIFNRLSRLIKNDIDLLVSFFKKAASSNELLDRNLVRFEELDRMSESANRMLEDKIQAEKEKEELTRKLHQAQKMESLGLMAGGVAHDLNNILAGIVGYPEILLQTLPQDSALRKPIEAIRESGQRAAAVVADLLTVARSAASTREPCDLNVLLQASLDSPESWKNKFLYPDISYQCRFDAADSFISCSPVHVQKCFMNLTTNASEAIAGSGTITITTSNKYIDDGETKQYGLQAGEYIVLTVQDSGPGIASTDLDNIFEPFFSKKKLGRSGSGLGLAIVWNTMEDHGGRVLVESSDAGTCFRLYFPVCKDKNVSSENEKYETNTGNGEHILVVDDERLLRDIAQKMLQSLGYRVDTVASGEQALQFLEESPVDLILIDMLMEPGMNGRQTYEKIIQLYPGQKAVIASGFSESEDVKSALKQGIGGFLKKPYTMEQLANAVGEALRG